MVSRISAGQTKVSGNTPIISIVHLCIPLEKLVLVHVPESLYELHSVSSMISVCKLEELRILLNIKCLRTEIVAL